MFVAVICWHALVIVFVGELVRLVMHVCCDYVVAMILCHALLIIDLCDYICVILFLCICCYAIHRALDPGVGPSW